jgi:hypothetical protein
MQKADEQTALEVTHGNMPPKKRENDVKNGEKGYAQIEVAHQGPIIAHTRPEHGGRQQAHKGSRELHGDDRSLSC